MSYTPAIQQYIDIKKQYADCILFFRMGDFYETFFEDAHLCSKLLDIILTSKNKGAENPVPMAGIPFHSVDKYITKLIHNGYKVAIAEQTSEPVPGKIVEREVTAIITPGTYIQEGKKDFTYMMALTFSPHKDGLNYHIAWGDFSIGEYRTKSFGDIAQMQKFILAIKPVEIIFDIDFPQKDLVSTPLHAYLSCLISVHAVPVDPEKYITTQVGVQSVASFGQAVEDGRLDAAALLIHYLTHTQKTFVKNISRIALHTQDKRVLLDDITIKNLELFASSYEGSEKQSLIGILDHTQTYGGARLLRYLLANPLQDIPVLNERLMHIQYYVNKIDTTRTVHSILHHVLDIPKIISTILYKKLSVVTFIKLRSTLRIFFEKQILLEEIIRLGVSENIIGFIQNLYNYLDQLIKDDTDYQDDIDFIRDGHDSTIDELRKVAYHSDELLLGYQQELIQLTGIANVKIKFVMNQGYFIEITNKDIQTFEQKLEKIGDEKYALVRRNTLKGGQRYTSGYLDHLQSDILEAKQKLSSLEFGLLEKAKTKITGLHKELSLFAEYIAWLDIYTSHALFAKEHNWNKPVLTTTPGLHITKGRHPVIQEFLPKDQQFIPNDLTLYKEDQGFLHIITGPNMGGKSTYLRQNALLVLLAHCGLFVPAETAEIGIVDALFARVGSGDIITKNQSTFMTEMIEVANILNNATNKSFIIFDELGRGTATYDGLALTKAILEYIALQLKAKTLIATHYHELIKMEGAYDGVKNFSVSVYETDKEVVFMKKIVPGGANKSYGIDVAKLAGIPSQILERARENLGNLEQGKLENKEENTNSPLPFTSLHVSDPRYQKIKTLLESYDVNNLTPLQALQLLSKIKDDLT